MLSLREAWAEEGVWAFQIFAKFAKHPWPARADAILGPGPLNYGFSATVWPGGNVHAVVNTVHDFVIEPRAGRMVQIGVAQWCALILREMAMADNDWREVPLDTLTEAERLEWDGMKAAYRIYQDMKANFQTEFSRRFEDILPADKELKFGYNFGKLSIAVGPKRERKVAKGGPAQSLGDWLAAQAASGHNS